MVDRVDLIEYVVMRLLREACYWDLIQGKEIEGCVLVMGVMGKVRAVRCPGLGAFGAGERSDGLALRRLHHHHYAYMTRLYHYHC